MLIILATQEAEIRRIMVQGHGKIVHQTLSQKKKKSQKKADGVVQGVGPEFKPQYHKKKKEREKKERKVPHQRPKPQTWRPP
jgi:hypothetical protein